MQLIVGLRYLWNVQSTIVTLEYHITLNLLHRNVIEAL